MQKSIKQQYLELKEGKMTQSNFMRSMRMSLPQYVTNVTSFGDTVKILKNKGIISEVVIKENFDFDKSAIESASGDKISHTEEDDFGRTIYWSTKNPDVTYYIGSDGQIIEYNSETGKKHQIGDLEHYDTSDDDDESSYDYEPDTDADYEEPRDDFDMAGDFMDGEFWEGKINEAKDSTSGYYNQDGKEQISHFKEIDNMNGQEIFAGIKIEHGCYPEKSYAEIEKLVIKNIKKIPNYYTNYKLSGVAGFEPKIEGGVKPEDRQMKPVKDGNVVDKAMGMKPVKGFEKAKASSNKAKKETSNGEHIELMTLISKTVRGIVKMDATGEKGKKITMKEGNEYQFNGYFKTEEEAKLKSIIPDAEIEVDEEPGQTIKTVVSSSKYNEKAIKHAVDNILGLNKSQPEMGGQGIAKALTKEDIEAMVREVMDETFDGRDNLTDVTGENI